MKNIEDITKGIQERFEVLGEMKSGNIEESMKKLFPMTSHDGVYELCFVKYELSEPTLNPTSVTKGEDLVVPVKGTFRLKNNVMDEIIETEVFLGYVSYENKKDTSI